MARSRAVVVDTPEEGLLMGRGVPISVRVPPEMAKRIDRLVAKLAKDPALSTLGTVSRSVVVKLALVRGVQALEEEEASKKSGR